MFEFQRVYTEMFTLYFITITVILTGLFVKYFGNALWFSRKLPGPPALPIIGNALLFINKSPTGRWKLNHNNEILNKFN